LCELKPAWDILFNMEDGQMDNAGFLGRQPRRKFLTGFLATVAAATTALLASKKARAVEKSDPAPEAGPILYHRTEETERYYRTLYR
jgi:hypothetical protein